MGAPSFCLRPLPVVGLVVSGQLQAPEVAFHRLLAARLVLLLAVRDLVRRDLREVFLAGRHGACYGHEARAQVELVALQGRRARHFLADVDAVTVFAGRLRHAVRAKQHLAATVLPAFSGVTQCAGHTVDSGTPYNFCHSLLAILGHGLT